MNNTFTALNRCLEQNNYNYNSYYSLPIKNNIKKPTFILEPYTELQELIPDTELQDQQMLEQEQQMLAQEQEQQMLIQEQEQQMLIQEQEQQMLAQEQEQQMLIQEQEQQMLAQEQEQQMLIQEPIPNIQIKQIEEPIPNIQIKQIQEPVVQNIIDDGLPDVECNKRIDIIKKDLSLSIAKYIDLLCEELLNSEIISLNEIQNIKTKIKNNQVDINTIISYLENKKILNRQISISGGDKHAKVTQSFDNILSGKWQVPMPRPPVCLPSEITKINQYDSYTSNFSLF
jgi:hypothetical protein